jgi:CRP-like cAMP-binding protein
MAVTPELLKSFPLLNGLAPESLADLAEDSAIQKYSRRAIVLTAGKATKDLCFLFEGRLQGVDFTIDGREVGLYFVEPGGFCGELALFDNGTQPEHVMALTPVVVVMIPFDSIKKVTQRNPEIFSSLGAKLANKVRQMTFQRSLLGLPNIAQRVCCQLWLLIPAREKEKMQSGEVSNIPTHMEIAIMLSVSRETVTRVFQNLQNRGIVRRSGGSTLIISDLPSLKALAEGTSEL